VNRTATAIGAYYLNAHMYTYVPRHIRADMEWMADIGTQYVCVGVLEQDLFAAYENHALIAQEAARVGMRVLAVPSRWGGLTAGAPKVPSLFTMLNPETKIANKQGRTALMPKVSGGISSVHHPATFKFSPRRSPISTSSTRTSPASSSTSPSASSWTPRPPR
jgi:hypothetical protein